MPAIEMFVNLERSVGGKTKIKAYAEAFSITGFIRRETSSTCFLRMEAPKKVSIIDCLGALYNKLENTDFDIMTETVKSVGRRTYTQFAIIESQDWKKKWENNVWSSDNCTTVASVDRDKCFKNINLTRNIRKKIIHCI